MSEQMSESTNKKIKMTSPSDDELASLKGKLAAAEKGVEEWSSLVNKAIRGEAGHTEHKQEYKEREAFYLGRVTALEAQIASKCSSCFDPMEPS